MAQLGDSYSTYSPSIQAMSDLMRNGLRRIAFIGTPCQIKSVRKMQLLGIVPSDAIKYCFGLFCSANYTLPREKLSMLPQLAGRDLDTVSKMNIKNDFVFYFEENAPVTIDLETMSAFKRQACTFCDEFSAEFADISFGGVGSEDGWTTVVTRTPLGRAVFADALDTSIEQMSIDENRGCSTRAIAAVMQSSEQKRLARP